MSKTYWYCPYCGEEVDPQNVTNQEMHEDCGHPVTLVDDSLPTYNQLQAENARLREALEKITYPNLYIDKNQYGATWKSIARKYYEIAEKALKEGNDER